MGSRHAFQFARFMRSIQTMLWYLNDKYNSLSDKLNLKLQKERRKAKRPSDWSIYKLVCTFDKLKEDKKYNLKKEKKLSIYKFYLNRRQQKFILSLRMCDVEYKLLHWFECWIFSFINSNIAYFQIGSEVEIYSLHKYSH